ncbi:MAG: 50S ribosomal protein L20 [Planctomycetota bacterium]
MPRVRKGSARHQKHRKILKQARGYYGRHSRNYRLAKQAVFRAGVNRTRDRRLLKRSMRRLWITRISAACKMRGIRYSQLMHGMFEAHIDLNRKMLAEIAIADPAAFDQVVQAACKVIDVECTAAATA